MFLPDAIKNRIVSAGIGLANGTVYLASAPQGVQDFITDRAIDALSYGANKIGINTESFDRANAQIRQARAERWQDFSNLQTANLSRLDMALDDKIRRGLPLNATDIPERRKSSAASRHSRQNRRGDRRNEHSGASRSDGGSQRRNSFRRNLRTDKRRLEGTWSAAQTATLPISKAIPGVGSEALDLATGYVVGKMRGANNVEILNQMLTQGLLGAGFKAGKKFGDLTAEQKQLAWQRFRRIGNEVNKVVDTQYALAKNVYQTIKNGLKVTDAQVQQARQTIRQFTIQQEKAPTFYTNGLEPKLVKAHTTLAINAVQKGLVRFEDFAAQMVKDAGDKIKPHLENIYRTVTRQFGLKPDEIGIAKSKLTGRTEAELKNDLDPTVRKGETSAQAQTRAAKAQEEIRILGVLKIYEAIGAETTHVCVMKLKRFEIEWREIGQEVRKQAKRVMKITRFCYLKTESR